jgi:hypothetical protein
MFEGQVSKGEGGGACLVGLKRGSVRIESGGE